jgi:hypothetical protein
MMKRKIASVALAAAALVGGPLAAAPVQAQELELQCEVFKDPYDYPCQTAEDTGNFVLGEAGEAIVFVGTVRDEAGEIVFRVYCIAFPNQPECQ